MLINSLPKSGTHLLCKLVGEFGYSYSGMNLSSTTIYGRNKLIKSLLRGPFFGEPSISVGLDVDCSVRKRWILSGVNRVGERSYIGGHLPYSDAMHRIFLSSSIKMMHILRDPRDVLLSWAHYVPTQKWHYARKGLLGLDINQRVLKIIDGYESDGYVIESFSSILNQSLGWISASGVKVIRFENLVGESGGGRKDKQLLTVMSIANYLQLVCDKPEIIAKNLFGGTKVFRKGQIGAWRHELRSETIDIMDRKIGHIVEKMGY